MHEINSLWQPGPRTCERTRMREFALHPRAERDGVKARERLDAEAFEHVEALGTVVRAMVEDLRERHGDGELAAGSAAPRDGPPLGVAKDKRLDRVIERTPGFVEQGEKAVGR